MAVFTLLLAAPEAQGQIEYIAPERCGSQAEVVTKFAELMGQPIAELPPIRARMVVEASTTHYILSYRAELQGTRSERTLELESCAAVVEAAALLLVISVDPSLAASLAPAETRPDDAPRPPPVVVPAANATSSPPKPSPAASQLPRPERKRLSGFVGAALSGSSSLTPTVAGGGGAQLGAQVGPFSFGIKSLIEATPLPAQPSAEVDVSALLWRNRAWASAAFPVGPVRMGPYLGLGLEFLHVWASGLSSGGSGSSPFLSACAGGTALWGLGPSVALELDLGLTVPFERPAFSVNGLENPVHRPGAVSADLSFGINWSFGSQ